MKLLLPDSVLSGVVLERLNTRIRKMIIQIRLTADSVVRSVMSYLLRRHRSQMPSGGSTTSETYITQLFEST